MHKELRETVTGVGALIVVPENLQQGFITIEERTNKRSSNKLQGMRSIPMETVEGEEDHKQALERLLREEVSLSFIRNASLTDYKLGRFELTPRVVLHAYVLETRSDVEISLGEGLDITNPQWTRFNEVLKTAHGRERFRFRPAVYEVVQSYIRYISNPRNYTPRNYTQYQIIRRIPEEVFDLIDKGVSAEEALSLVVPVLRHQPKYPTVAH